MCNASVTTRMIFATVAPLISQPPAMGALPTLRAATDPGVAGGQYYGPAGMNQFRGYPHVVTSGPQSCDTAEQDHLRLFVTGCFGSTSTLDLAPLAV